MAFFLRRLVSQQKRRFQQDGFDLDLAYITPRIIAMGLPAEGGEGFFRNPMSEIQRFLQTRHTNRHRVYNLCAERTYNPEKLLCEVAHYPFDDHQPPPLAMVNEFVNDATSWLAAHPENVVAVHCKAGKGRTGTMICCLLLYLAMQSPNLVDGFQPAEDAVSDVLHWYADKRTMNRKGITLQSQQRFVNYYYNTLQCPTRHLEFTVQVHIQEIRIRNLPMHIIQSAMVTVYHRDNTRHTRPCVSGSPLRRALKAAACITGKQEEASAVSLAGSREVLVNLAEQPALAGDIKLQLFRGASSLFYTWFNTAFLPPATSTYTLTTPDLDRPSRDLPQDVTVEIIYHHPPAHPLTPRRAPHSPPSSRLLPAATATAHAAAAAESDIEPFVSDAAASPTGSSPSPPPRRRPEHLPSTSAAPPLVPRLPLNALYTTAHPASNLLVSAHNPPTPHNDPYPPPPPAPAPPNFHDDSVQVQSVLSLRLPRPLISPLVSPRLPSPGTPPAHEPRAPGLRKSSSTISLDETTSETTSHPHPPAAAPPAARPTPSWNPLALTLRPIMSGHPSAPSAPRPSIHTAPAEASTSPPTPANPTASPRPATATLVLKPQLLYSCPVPPPPKKPSFLRALLNRFRPRKHRQQQQQQQQQSQTSDSHQGQGGMGPLGPDGQPMDFQQWQQFQQAWHTRWWMTLEEED